MNVIFSDRVQRILFFITVLITIVFLLYPKYLPMTDLPQHAALVVSLDDLLKGNSDWESMLWINRDTPYIVLYLYWLLIYQFFSILWATKIVVISVFLLYIYAIRLLRKTFQADKMLDWVGLTCFFGYSFEFGFISYILGISFGLLFLALNKRYLDNTNNKDLFLIILTGVLTYYSHLLAFVFFCMTAYAYFLFASFNNFSWQQRIKFTFPYILFALLLLHYLTTPNPVSTTWWLENETAWSIDKSFNIALWKHKVFAILFLPWSQERLYEHEILIVLLLLSPLFLAKITHNKTYYIPFLCIIIVYLIMPRKMMESFYLYHRFAWLIPIFYFLLWQFRPFSSKNGYRFNIAQLFSLMFMFAIFSLLCRVYVNQVYFAQSPSIKDMEVIQQQMKPKKRILYLFEDYYNPHSEDISPNNFYGQLGSYYQALKHGWVDKSFASEHAIPVRLTKEANYSKNFRKNTQISPNIFKNKLDCTPYDYLIIRSSFSANTLTTLFKDNAQCSNMRIMVETKSLILLGKNEK